MTVYDKNNAFFYIKNGHNPFSNKYLHICHYSRYEFESKL